MDETQAPMQEHSPKQPGRLSRSVKKVSSLAADDLWQRVGRGVLYIATLALPWFFIPLTIAPVETGKLLLVAALGTIGLIAFLAETIERRKLQYPSSWLSLGVLAVLVTAGISTVFSISRSMSVFGVLIQPDSLVVLALAALFFFLTTAFIRKEHLGFLVKMFLIGTGITSLIGIVSLLGLNIVPFDFASQGGFTPVGSMSAWGFLVVAALGLSALLSWNHLGSKTKSLLGIGVILWVVSLFLLNFQELWLGLAFVGLLTAAIGFMRQEKIRLPLVLSVIALCFTLIGPRIPSLITPQLEVRPNLVSSLQPAKDVALSARVLTGTGPSTFAYKFAESRPQNLNLTNFWQVRFNQGSSFVVTAMTTVGLLGVLAWVLLAVGAFRSMRSRLSDSLMSQAALFTVFTGIALLVYVGFFIQLILGAIALGVVSVLNKEQKSLVFSGKTNWKLLVAFLALIFVSAGVLSGAYFLGQKYVSAAYYGSGARALASGDTDRALLQLDQANRLDGASDETLRLLSQSLMTKFQELASGSDATEEISQQVQSIVTLAVQAAQQATTVNASDPANWSNLGSIYEALTPLVEGTDQLALEAYDEAAKRDPQGPQWPLAKARTLGALASYQERNEQPTDETYTRAQAEIDRALELKGNYEAARFLGAQLLFRAGDAESAIARVNEVREQNPFDAGIAFQLGLLYYQNDQLNEARGELERALSLDDNFANARYFLGLSQSRLGDTDAALSSFRWLDERNPENPEITQIISNLESGLPVLDGIVTSPLDRSDTPLSDTGSITSDPIVEEATEE